LTRQAARATIKAPDYEVIMLAYIFLALAVGFRFLPQTLGFTPVTAALLFFGCYSSRRRIWIPVVALAASDFLLTTYRYAYPFTWDHYVTFLWYAAVAWLGTGLRNNPRPLRIIGAALAGSISFFLVSNFAFWTTGIMYPRSLDGLLTCFAAALPFFRRGLEGDLLFTCVMFATPALVTYLSGVWEKSGGGKAAAA
jgi:hypothetical protein